MQTRCKRNVLVLVDLIVGHLAFSQPKVRHYNRWLHGERFSRRHVFITADSDVSCECVALPVPTVGYSLTMRIESVLISQNEIDWLNRLLPREQIGLGALRQRQTTWPARTLISRLCSRLSAAGQMAREMTQFGPLEPLRQAINCSADVQNCQPRKSTPRHWTFQLGQTKQTCATRAHSAALNPTVGKLIEFELFLNFEWH